MVMLFRFAPPAVAAAMLALIVSGGPLSIPARTISIACIVASFIAASLVRRPDVRTHATVALAVGAFVAAGQVRAGGRYALGATIFVGVVIASLRMNRIPVDARGAAGTPLSGGRRRAAVVLALSSSLVGGLLVWQLPRVGAAVEVRVARWLGNLEADEVTGFSSQMRLGSTRGMLKSDRIVLRVEGDPSKVEYLRGATFDRYTFEEWSSTTDAPPRTILPATSAPEQATMKVVQARTARVALGSEARWFVPARACDFGTPTGKVAVDRGAVFHPDVPADPPEIWFRVPERPEDCASPPPSAAPPGPNDLVVEFLGANDVRRISAEWTTDADDPRAKLAAIEQHLQSFGYSLDVRRNAHYDSVVDFLLLHREGHCEMFASAMALLARAQGIPARVVTGYRGGDVNRVGGYTIVRERNAHAWVEAWVDGQWRSFDPTPPIEGMRREPGTVSAALDVASYSMDRAVLALGRITLLPWGIGLGVVAAVLYAIREITLRLAKRRAKGKRSVFGEHAPSLPAFDALTEALAAAGHPRVDSEPIESFARRLLALGAPWTRAVAEALSGYAALRYGDRGEEKDVVEKLERAAKVTSSARSATAP
jgi:protein-glutamine gamma-glutamyltransferase